MEIFKDCSCKMGDYIGTESCVDFGMEIGNEEKMSGGGVGIGIGGDVCNRRRQLSSEFKRREKKKNYPPPIPLLARTENLAPHMPWILRRYYTSDGRLIIEREKVRHHEYFHAYRSGGRLTLWLVPLDDVVYPNRINEEEAEAAVVAEAEELETVTDEKDGEDEVTDELEIDPTVPIDPTVEDDNDDDDGDNAKLVIPGSPAGACCNFSRDRKTTSFFRVNMPSVRPVYI